MPDQLETNFSHLSHGDYILKIDGFADILLVHPKFSCVPWPDFVPSPQELKDQLNNIRHALTAAADDPDKSSLVAALRSESQQSVVFTTQYLVMKAIRDKDVGVLHTVGLPLKTRTHYNKAPDTVSTAPATLVLKHGPVSGMVIAKAEKVVGAGGYELQVTEGNPSHEETWRTAGMYKSSHRMQVRGLTEATKCHFRVRGHGANGPGPWSAAVSLVIL